MTNLPELLRILIDGKVKFIVVGGVAATAHGSLRTTIDLDIVYSRDTENLQRIADALKPIHPYLRGAPPNLPFVLDQATLQRGLNFTADDKLGSNRPSRGGCGRRGFFFARERF